MLTIRNFAVFLALLAAVACQTKSTVSSQESTIADHTKNRISYLALGDSYTIGEKVAEELTFPFQLTKTLQEKTKFIVEKPVVIAKTGWRTDELLDAMKVVENKYDLVSVLIGVNNQYQGKDIGQFREEFQTIVEQAIGFSRNGKKGVFIYSIPDYSVMPFMRGKDIQQVSAEIKNFNGVCQTVSKQLGVSFYDITPISQKAQFDNHLIANDKLHPSGKMYSIWISETVDRIISNQLK